MFGQNKPFSFALTSTPASTAPASTTPFSFGAAGASTASNPITSTQPAFSFGGAATNTTTSANPPSTNLFGTSASSLGLGGGLKSSSTNLFGSTANTTSTVAPTAQPSQPSSLFNFNTSASTPNPAPNTIQQPATNTTSLFGSSSSGLGGVTQTGFNKTGTPSFSFGSNTNAPAPAATNLFGQTSTASATLPTATTSTLSSSTTPSSTGFNLGSSGSSFNFNASGTNTQPNTADPNKSLFGSSSSNTTNSSTTTTTTKPSFGFLNTSVTQTSLPTPVLTATVAPNISVTKSSTSTGGFGGFSFSGSTTDINKTANASATASLPQSSTTNSLSSLSTTKPTVSLTFPNSLNTGGETATAPASQSATPFSTTSSTVAPATTITTTPATTSTTTTTNTNDSKQSTLSFPSLIKSQPTTAAPAVSATTASQSNEVKPTISLTKETTTASTTATTTDKTDTKANTSLDLSRTQTLVNAEASLPTVSSFAVPGLTSNKNLDSSTTNKPSSSGSLLSSLSGSTATTTASSTTGQANSNSNDPNVSVSSGGQSIIRSLSIKDQPLPQQLLECVENFKKHLEETRKLKELNSAFNSRTLNQNIHEIMSVKQRLSQTGTELQHNLNESSKLKEQISKELRHVDICDNLKNMPLGLQYYDTEIWNEYFLTRVQQFQNKMRMFKIQFEQLEGYFRVHDKDNMFDSQKILETLKATHRNLLNEAANLKLIHEEVENLKKSYLTYKRNLNGDMTNIFENETDENQPQHSFLQNTANRI